MIEPDPRKNNNLQIRQGVHQARFGDGGTCCYIRIGKEEHIVAAREQNLREFCLVPSHAKP